MTDKKVNKTEIINKVMPIAEKAAEELNLILLEVDFVQEFNKWHLKLFIYNPQRTITHEDCEKVTGKLAESFDSIISVPYYLEVSSPGTERKLKSPREYLIFKGKRVKVKVKQLIENENRTFTGTIIDFNNEKGLTIQSEETENLIEIKEDNISSIKLEPKYNY